MFPLMPVIHDRRCVVSQQAMCGCHDESHLNKTLTPDQHQGGGGGGAFSPFPLLIDYSFIQDLQTKIQSADVKTIRNSLKVSVTGYEIYLIKMFMLLGLLHQAQNTIIMIHLQLSPTAHA
jgi:hypothetical protein